jgi:hypothetical protein
MTRRTGIRGNPAFVGAVGVRTVARVPSAYVAATRASVVRDATMSADFMGVAVENVPSMHSGEVRRQGFVGVVCHSHRFDPGVPPIVCYVRLARGRRRSREPRRGRDA